ncbi:MAG: WecB/TagA/CpsF family glycosyltransferase [Candidatus Korobacteraceae bacterium]
MDIGKQGERPVAAAVGPEEHSEHRRILGISFFVGSVKDAISRMKSGGLLVVPAAPALLELSTKQTYREALLSADLVIPDSGFMVLVWNLIARDSVVRLSGLAYLRELLKWPAVRVPGSTFWVMPNERSAERNIAWLRTQGLEVSDDDYSIAPLFSGSVTDPVLLSKLEERRPQHVIIALGGGTQECLGLYLRDKLAYKPSIHCIGAALAFLSGDQVGVPVWADKLYLGWLFRCLSNPSRFIPRYFKALKVAPLLLRYRTELPELDTVRPQHELPTFTE